MEEMVLLTIITRSKESARQTRPPSNPPKRVEATLRQTAERGIAREEKAPLYLEGQGEALRVRNRPSMIQFLPSHSNKNING